KLNRHLGVTDTRSVLDGGSVSSWRTNPLNGTTPRHADGTPYNAMKFDFSRGYVGTNADSFATNVDGVFACGDFVTGPATIIEAAGRGRRAARAVDRWLTGARDVELEELPVINRAVITQTLEHDMPKDYESVERYPTNCITMDRLELERFTPDGKVLLESYKDNVLGQIGQEAGMPVQR